MSDILRISSSNWQAQTKGQRAFASCAAVLISLTFLAQFNQQFTHTLLNDGLTHSREFILTWIAPSKIVNQANSEQVAATSPTNKAAQAKSSTRDPAKAKTRQTDTANIATTTPPLTITNKEPDKDIAESNVTDPLAAPATKNTTKDATLGAEHRGTNLTNLMTNGKPNSAAVRAAYEASKSDIQKMAEANNKTLITTPNSKYEKFQDAANRAAKPDCLRQGGSILSLFVVAYQAATDHCK
ncbi:hypothetical protein [Undibacterium danionis]|uniref:ESPR domain-containing protein n=1 Tax=Undibacterium danionis TaxID=1812100 RepID=A0ABV6IGS3_9BURK